jgi:hypothetical protein
MPIIISLILVVRKPRACGFSNILKKPRAIHLVDLLANGPLITLDGEELWVLHQIKFPVVFCQLSLIPKSVSSVENADKFLHVLVVCESPPKIVHLDAVVSSVRIAEKEDALDG